MNYIYEHLEFKETEENNTINYLDLHTHKATTWNLQKPHTIRHYYALHVQPPISTKTCSSYLLHKQIIYTH